MTQHFAPVGVNRVSMEYLEPPFITSKYEVREVLSTIATLEQQLAEARADREVGARYVRMLVGGPAFHDSIGNALAWAEKGCAK